MNHWIVLVLTIAAGQPLFAFDNATNNSPPQLIVCLTDGSRLRGTTTLQVLTLRSEALGKLTVPLERIRQVKFSKDRESVTVTLHNGDRLQAGLADTTLALTTLFGPVTVPLDKVTEMQVRTGGRQAVEWEIEPFPQDSNWGGPRGQPCRLEDDGIVFFGQPIRTKQTFAAPTAFESDVVWEEGRQSDGALWFNLVPKGAEPGLNPPPGNIMVTFGYRQPGGRGGHVSVDQQQLTREPFVLEKGKAYRLMVEVLADRIRVTLDGQAYESAPMKYGFEEFHVRLMGWQPGNTWRVRNVSVR